MHTYRSRLALAILVLLALPAVSIAADLTTVPPFVSVGAPYVAIDASGNRYLAGNFSSTLDFNPAAGSDEKTAAGTSGYITSFDSTGNYRWTKTTGVGSVRGLTISGSTLYVAGDFQGTNVSVGGVGTISCASAIGRNVYVLALSTADGSPLTSFSTDGVQIFGGSANDIAGGNNPITNCLTVSNNVLYVAGSMTSANCRVDASGTSTATIGSTDAFVLALNASTGAAITTFGRDLGMGVKNGVQHMGGLLSNSFGNSVCAAGGRVYLAGTFQNSLSVDGGSSEGANGQDSFVLALDAASGSAVTAFSGNGIQSFGGTGFDFGIAVAADANRVYLVGSFEDSGVGIGGTGTFASASTITGASYGLNIFVIALNTTDGTGAAGFGTNGVQLFLDMNLAEARGVLLNNGTLYVSGFFGSKTAGIGSVGTVRSYIQSSTLKTGLVLALNAETGAARTEFSSDGILDIIDTVFYGLALSPDGKTLFATGDALTADLASSPVNGNNPGILLAVDAQTGASTQTVRTLKANGAGSLLSAVYLARAGSAIVFDDTLFDLRNSDAATVLAPSSLTFNDNNITLDAQNHKVTLNGISASSDGILVTGSGNVLRGFSMVGYRGNAIALQAGASNNILGGDRSMGAGPNGQGLRIADCTQFAIRMQDSGTTGNVVKGCWIGLDASGVNAKPNLAGILMRGGCTGNVIGSTVVGEQNVISGNDFEGITVADAGTDNNIVIGNIVGLAGIATAGDSKSSLMRALIPTRSAISNGSSGVFLSQGTTGTRTGGETDAESNNIAANGGNGIEVRATASRKNGALRNRITRNLRGGIALFDGSNDNIKPPVLASIDRLPTRANGSRSVATVRISGMASGTGRVELFNDSGLQGDIFLTRANVANGLWTAEVDVDELLNVTATYTDDNGNTSPFANFKSIGPEGDKDGDGVPDDLETLAGTDPTDAADAPDDGGTVVLGKSQIAFNFAKPGNDSAKLLLRFLLPEDYAVEGSILTIRIGTVTLPAITLNSKASGKASNATAKISGIPSEPDALRTAVSVLYSAKKLSLSAALSESGFQNATIAAPGESVETSIGLVVESAGKTTAYHNTIPLTYTAKQNKSGKATR